MEAPKRMFPRQQRLSRRGFDRLVTLAKKRERVVTDPTNGKTQVMRRKRAVTDAQAIVAALCYAGVLRKAPCTPTP